MGGCGGGGCGWYGDAPGAVCAVCDAVGLLVRRRVGRGFEKENLEFWLMGVALISEDNGHS